MARFWLFTIGGGVTSALLYLSMLLYSGGMSGAALLLSYIAQLPIFMVGLALGPAAGAFAGLTGIVMSTVIGGGLIVGALYLGVHAVPSVLLIRQAMLNRTDEQGQVEWYPSRLLAGWLTALGLAASAIALAVPFVIAGGLEAGLKEIFGDRIARMPQIPGSAANDLPGNPQLATLLAVVFVGLAVASWQIMILINATLAQGLLARFGLNMRPGLDIAYLELPRWIGVALLAALPVALVAPGDLGLVGINAVLVLSIAFLLLGFGVMHFAVRRWFGGSLALVLLYPVVLITGFPLLLILLFGLIDHWTGLRRRLDAST